MLKLCRNVTDGLHVNEKIVDRTCREYLPFIATENLLMEAVKRGGDRQKLHEIIRVRSMEATMQMRDGKDCDLLERLAQEPEFALTREEMENLLDPARYIGRCAEQVKAYCDAIAPLLSGASEEAAEINL